MNLFSRLLKSGFLIWLLVFTLFLCSACGDGKKYHDQAPTQKQSTNETLGDILGFQASLNASFRDPEVSPLPDRYRKDFEGLEFFPPDTVYRVWAQLERTPEALPFDMPTNTLEFTKERVYGRLYFELEGSRYRLEVYQSPELTTEEGFENYLFLPFTDLTNGKTSYEGGRYIDLRIPDSDSILLDFNKAYNPYCAYNPSYSCPVVPEVNHLDTEIRAGVKAFGK
ncbi:MAG: DUF1684 domain-containing protein [Robiginitalea sp.]